MKTFLNILYWFLIVFALIQFIPINRTNKPVDSKVDFVKVYKTPKNVEKLLRNACYDCHSNETVYPDYAFVAPISWSIKHHVNEGRERVNFSVWSTYNTDQKNHIIDDILETVESKEMPLKGYLPMHPEANLTDAQRKIFNDYFKNLQKSGNF